MEESCVNQGWELLVYFGTKTTPLSQLKEVVDDPQSNIGPYYWGNVAGRTWLQLTILAIWFVIFWIYFIWQVCLVAQRCCYRKSEYRLTRIQCYKILADTWAKFIKALTVAFGLLVVAACIYGICTLSSLGYVAEDSSLVIEKSWAHFDRFTDLGSQVAYRLETIPDKLQIELARHNSSNQYEAQVESVEATVNNMSKIVQYATDIIAVNVAQKLEDFQSTYDSKVRDKFWILHIVVVYILLPVVIMITAIMVVFACVNFLLGVEITMLLSIIMMIVLVAVGVFFATVALTNNDICKHSDDIFIYKVQQKSVFASDFVRSQVVGIDNQGILTFWEQRLNVDVVQIRQQVDDILNKTEIFLQDAPDLGREIKGLILNTQQLIDKFLRQITFEQLNPLYYSFKGLTCCQFKEYLVKYNFSAILVGIFLIPLIISLFIQTHRLRKLPPPMVGWGFCHVRSQQEFELNVPIQKLEGQPRFLKNLIFSRGRRQQEALPYLYVDNSTTQITQQGNVPVQNQEKKV